MKYAIVLAAAAAVALIGATASAGTLDDVNAKGVIRCGVSQGLPGFSNLDDQGNWSGIDVDLCRAVAAAVLGNPNRVEYEPLSAKDRFDALREGRVDVLSRNTTWTLVRDATGLEFAAVIYYDGQAFMIRKDLGLKSARELNGAAICVTAGTTTRINLADYFRTHNMTYTAEVFADYDQMIAAYDAGRCDAFTADQSALYGHRTKLKDPAAHIILPELISKEPLGPVVRQPGCDNVGDSRWLEVIRWTLYAMIEAEERGVSSINVDAFRAKSKNPGIRRLLGVEGGMGRKLGLPNDWAYKIIKLVGNYAEIYERNLGPDTRLKIPRGLNALWTAGGLQYAMPII